MLNCPTCRGRMRRIHRTLSQKFLYVAMYECQQCHTTKPEPRMYALYLGDHPCCPHCGTQRITRLATPDRIDPIIKNVVSRLQGLLGAPLYHCRYCRIQFHDMRKPLPQEKERAMAAAAGGRSA